MQISFKAYDCVLRLPQVFFTVPELLFFELLVACATLDTNKLPINCK